MRRIVVHDEMHVWAFWHGGVNLFEEVQKLGRAMTPVAFSDDSSGRDIQRGKQRRRSISDVGVGASLGHAGGHGKDRLISVQRLDLGFLVYTQHHRCTVSARLLPGFIFHDRSTLSGCNRPV